MTTLSRSLLFVLLALPVPLAWADPPAEATAAPVATSAPAPAPEAAAPVAPAAAPAAASAAASTAPPAPSTTEPSVILNSQINSGDTAWMLASMALVLMMTVPGLALFYGGMVRQKNVLATLMQSFAITCLVTLLWYVIGYSLAFTPGTPYIGGLSRVFFAIITPALICGAFAERMKFSAMLWFMAIWSIIVYAPIAHWMWEPGGWGATAGVLDFAGGTVVHINSGIAALACALALGKRVGLNKEPMAPHNLVLTVIGASLLWVGWFGFNAGSAVAADGRAGMAMAVTQIATAAAALAWMFMEWTIKRKPSVLGIASGAVAGLVAITPASGFVMPTPAVIIGIAAGVICFFAATSLKKALGY
ncbi:MAG: ammonium transporter, partial [Gammaproteobacteria bacterium]